MKHASRVLPLCRWVDSAACVTRPDLPWLGDADCLSADDRDALSAVCAGCPVFAPCAASADALDATAAWWAGRHRGPAMWEQSVLTWPEQVAA